jgi:hypothetical protein
MNDQDLERPTRPTVLDGLISARELQSQLGYRSRQTLHNLIGQGMPSIRLGSRRLFEVEAVRRWILDQQPDLSPRKPGRPRRRR